MALVTLTSDFGQADGYVGAMKGVILARAPDTRIIDIAHDVPACNIAAGAYCLAQAAPYFPPGTIHVAVVDPGVGSERKPVIVAAGRHVFLGPDNGLLTLAAPRPSAVHVIEAPGFRLDNPSATFHGRDIFAAAAATLARGGKVEDAGPATTLSPLELPGGDALAATPVAPDERAVAILHVDHFGNLITSCSARDVPPGAHVQARGRVIPHMSRTFSNVERGQLVAYIGSGGFLEIAIREGNAARELDLAAGDCVILCLPR